MPADVAIAQVGQFLRDAALVAILSPRATEPGFRILAGHGFDHLFSGLDVPDQALVREKRQASMVEGMVADAMGAASDLLGDVGIGFDPASLKEERCRYLCVAKPSDDLVDPPWPAVRSMRMLGPPRQSAQHAQRIHRYTPLAYDAN